jgi:hypothetical protein
MMATTTTVDGAGLGHQQRKGFVLAIALGMAALAAAHCGTPPIAEAPARLPPCPAGIVIGADINDNIHIRNTTTKGFDHVEIIVGGIDTLYGERTAVGDYRALLPRLDPSEDIDLTNELRKSDGSRWQRSTMRITSATVESAKVCQSGFTEQADHTPLRRLEKQ